MTRSAMLEVLGEDYIRTARAKGLSGLRVVALHALRNALIPVITVIGLQVGVLFTGAILTETIFSWPGWANGSSRRSTAGTIRCCKAECCFWARGDGRQPARRRHLRHHQPADPEGNVERGGTSGSCGSGDHAARARARILGLLQRESRRRGRADLRHRDHARRHIRAFHRAVPPDLTNNAVFLKPPAWQAGGSWAYPLGTDAIGRDILSRLIYGARLSLLIGVAVVAMAIVVGIALGLVAGFFRGPVEITIMRLMDIILTLPIAAARDRDRRDPRPGIMNAMLAVVVVVLPHYVRLTRAAVISETSKDYVTRGARSGATSCASCSRRCCPTCAAPLIVQASLGVSTAILDAAALGFLGLGAQPRRRSGARCLPTRASSCLRAWWVVTFPRPHDPVDGARVQSARRRVARRARSQTQALTHAPPRDRRPATSSSRPSRACCTRSRA
jgi:dipeptide transport system permease protein